MPMKTYNYSKLSRFSAKVNSLIFVSRKNDLRGPIRILATDNIYIRIAHFHCMVVPSYDRPFYLVRKLYDDPRPIID